MYIKKLFVNAILIWSGPVAFGGVRTVFIPCSGVRTVFIPCTCSAYKNVYSVQDDTCTCK